MCVCVMGGCVRVCGGRVCVWGGGCACEYVCVWGGGAVIVCVYYYMTWYRAKSVITQISGTI